jgi:hypothetical protein
MPQVEIAMPGVGKSWLGMTVTLQAKVAQTGSSPVQTETAAPVTEVVQLHVTAPLQTGEEQLGSSSAQVTMPAWGKRW